MARKPTRADLIAVMELVSDLSSQEWQEPDGTRKSAIDNSGERLWFVSNGVMQELKQTLTEAKDKP